MYPQKQWSIMTKANMNNTQYYNRINYTNSRIKNTNTYKLQPI